MHLFGCKFSLRLENGDTIPDRKNFDSLLWAIVTVFQVSARTLLEMIDELKDPLESLYIITDTQAWILSKARCPVYTSLYGCGAFCNCVNGQMRAPCILTLKSWVAQTCIWIATLDNDQLTKKNPNSNFIYHIHCRTQCDMNRQRNAYTTVSDVKIRVSLREWIALTTIIIFLSRNQIWNKRKIIHI